MSLHSKDNTEHHKEQMYPKLYLGYTAVTRFKKKHQGRVCSISSLDDVKALIAQYASYKSLPYELVIEDLSKLNSSSIATLLKFVEETSLKLVFLAIFDSVPLVFLSRMKFIEKEKDMIKSSFLSMKEALPIIEDLPQDLHPYARINKITEESPLLAVYDSSLKYRSCLRVLRVLK